MFLHLSVNYSAHGEEGVSASGLGVSASGSGVYTPRHTHPGYKPPRQPPGHTHTHLGHTHPLDAHTPW